MRVHLVHAHPEPRSFVAAMRDQDDTFAPFDCSASRSVSVPPSTNSPGVPRVDSSTDAFVRLVERNVAQAEALAIRIGSTPELELAAPVALNVVCFRFRWPGATEPVLAALNRDLLVELQESGEFVPSATELDGRFCLRVSITNHRTVEADLEALVEVVLARGRALRSRGGARLATAER